MNVTSGKIGNLSGKHLDLEVNLYGRYRYNSINKVINQTISRIDLGAGFYMVNELQLYPAFEIVPVGIQWGREVFFNAELGKGTIYALGGSVGIGFKL